METKASPILEEPKEVLPLAPEAASRQTTRHNLTSENVVAEQAADETWRLVQEHGATVGELTPEVERTLKRKIYLYVLVLVMVIDLMLYIDKATLSYAALLGIYEETGIDDTDYNNLNTLFYAGYMVGLLPGHYLMQKFPLGRFVAVSVLLWSVVVLLHCAAESYGGLVPLRFLLGVFEASLVSAMEVTLGMFLTPAEAVRVQPLFFISCLASPIPAGFLAYGLLHTHDAVVRPWKLFMLITGSLTLLLAGYCGVAYPDNPARARFLTVPERVHAIRRVHAATRSSIEQKTFKRAHVVECLRDPVSWLFGLTALTNQLSNNLAYQQNLLFLALGVDNLGSTLVSAAGGAFATVCAVCAFLGLRYLNSNNNNNDNNNSKTLPPSLPRDRLYSPTALWATFWSLLAVAGGIGMVTLPWTRQLPLLACMLLAGSTFGLTYILALGWNVATAGGYTKRLCRSVVWMAAYSVANLVSPQLWVARDAPRYYGAWTAQIVVSWLGAPACLLAIGAVLARRNRGRRAWMAEQAALGRRPVGVVRQGDGEGREGVEVEVEVDVSLLDLTDLENKYFLYQL